MKTSPLRLAGALGHEAADKRIDILRRIGAAGSISEAARAAGVSYKAAWQASDTLSNLAGRPLVVGAVGGSGGGGASLTDAGRQLLLAADEMARARDQVLARLTARQGSGAVDPVSVAALGLRTSMRNQLPCIVTRLQRKGTTVLVELALADGTVMASRITRESAQLLALSPGLAVLALFKATGVRIDAETFEVPAGADAPGMQAGAQASDANGRNLLRGHVVRTSRGAAGGEVALALPSGLRLVGFAGPGHGLRLREAAVASFDDTAVVLALAG